MAQKHRLFVQTSSVLSRLLLYTLINLAGLALANAEQTQDDAWLTQAIDTIKKQETHLKRITPENTTVAALSEPLKEIIQIKDQAQQCIVDAEAQLLKTNEDLETLGTISSKEPAAVSKKRHSLTNLQKDLDKQLSSCKLLLLQSHDLIQNINQLQQAILAQQLSARTPHILKVLSENIKAPAAGWHDSVEFLRAQYNLKLLSTQQLIWLLFFTIAGAGAGIYFERILRTSAARSATPKDSVSAFTLAVRTSLAPSLPVLLPVAIIAALLSIALPLSPLPFVTKASYMLAIYLFLFTTINILLNPAEPAPLYLVKPETLSKRFAQQLKILLTLGLVGFFLFTGEFKASLSEPFYYLCRSIYSVFLIINLVAILWLVRLFSWAIMSRGPRILLSMVLVSSLLAELTGYRNLSFFVLGGVLATSISLALTILAYRFLKDLCDGLDTGRLDWEKKFRQRVGLKAGALVPGLIWIRIIIFMSLWGGFAILALNIWKLDDPWLAIITTYFNEGFQIGSLNVTPALLGSGILAFAVTLNLTRYIKNHTLPQVLKYTRLDRGACEAVSSLVGYAGVAAAILIALSITGVQMQNIAIIAGALSVGIGFGLQNIVNNFISGLILLFERPIRRGDWIVTGETEGYVKAINIRSTQIETFDRADVIVPNSELITAKVTNWMLRDPYGRVRIPIGVGYDSDVEKVRDILLDIAANHPLVMNDNSQIASPKVLFRGFGESSLDFELRCFIRDVDQRLNVISEFNYAIIAAFRREGIEIPFPQRVLTVTNWQDKNKIDT